MACTSKVDMLKTKAMAPEQKCHVTSAGHAHLKLDAADMGIMVMASTAKLDVMHTKLEALE